jgi:hypothetical protein
MEADIISLGLKPHDSTPSTSGIPTAQVTVETYLVGRHELSVRMIYDTTNPDDLRKSFYTKWKKDVIEFDFGDSGKTVYFAVQIKNEGKKGHWYRCLFHNNFTWQKWRYDYYGDKNG